MVLHFILGCNSPPKKKPSLRKFYNLFLHVHYKHFHFRKHLAPFHLELQTMVNTRIYLHIDMPEMLNSCYALCGWLLKQCGFKLVSSCSCTKTLYEMLVKTSSITIKMFFWEIDQTCKTTYLFSKSVCFVN